MTRLDSFDYRTVLGPISFEADSRTVQDYKAVAGSVADSLRRSGQSGEQVENGLRTYFESVAAVLVEHLHAHVDRQQYSDAFVCVARALIDKVDPRENPCGRSYCHTCYPEAS